MNRSVEPQRYVASVLVIAVDQGIESLMGQLVAFAGHRPMYDSTTGAAGETIRRVRPDVVMLDVSLPPSVVEACLAGADEAGTEAVLTSSVASSTELAAEATARRALHFAMPGGPKPLAQVIERAVEARRMRAYVRVPSTRGDGTVHRAMCAAIAGVARSRVLALRMQQREQDRSPRADVRESPEDASRRALKAAVTDFARHLKATRTTEANAIERVRETIRICANVIGEDDGSHALLSESEGWTREAYHTA